MLGCVKASSTSQQAIPACFLVVQYTDFQSTSLAYAELYMTIACVFSRFELELWDVVRDRDITVAADFFLSEVRADSKGIRMKVLSER